VPFLILAVLLLGTFDLLRAAVRPAPVAPAEAWNILYFPPLHLAYFVFGMALCRLFLSGRHLPGASRFLFPVGLGLSLALLGLRADLPSWVLQSSFLPLAFGGTILGAAFWPARSVTAAAPLMLLGEASYSLYITHYPLMFLWRSGIGRAGEVPSWLNNGLFIVFAIAFSVVVYRFVEQPVRRWLLGHSPHPDALAATARQG
jgi:peptidoglycan/LPS O-acetylase OafA/YrhL